MNDSQVEEIKRHCAVVATALRSDLRQIAEGHAGIRRALLERHDELRDECKEMCALMRRSFSQLAQRIRTLETDTPTLKARMDHIETTRACLPAFSLTENFRKREHAIASSNQFHHFFVRNFLIISLQHSVELFCLILLPPLKTPHQCVAPSSKK